MPMHWSYRRIDRRNRPGGEDINRLPEDPDAFRAAVVAIRPAVELANVGFASLEGLDAVDLVASNVAASHLLLGAPVDPDQVELGAISAQLSRNGEEIISYRAEENDLDFWENARWLVGERLSRGWPVRKGHVLITGSLGAPRPGEPGAYSGDFGALGSVAFEIVAED